METAYVIELIKEDLSNLSVGDGANGIGEVSQIVNFHGYNGSESVEVKITGQITSGDSFPDSTYIEMEVIIGGDSLATVYYNKRNNSRWAEATIGIMYGGSGQMKSAKEATDKANAILLAVELETMLKGL